MTNANAATDPASPGATDSPLDWLKISAQLDSVLSVAPEQRENRLCELDRQDPALGSRLRRMLDRLASAEARGFLDRPVCMPQQDEHRKVAQPKHHVGQQIGPWQLKGLLGQGGMADVWQAARHDGQYQRTVALKLPFVSLRARLAKGWTPERNALAALDHPGIARLYDAGTDEQTGQPWLAMEWVHGQPLDAWCQTSRASRDQKISLLRAIAEALQYAHGRLIVHRDLKPSNILVDEAGNPHLLDFGIASQLHAEGLDAAPLLQGMTPGFAAPEQWLGLDSGTAVDVYALGVLAYLVLTGRHPFSQSESLGSLLRTQTAVRPSTTSAPGAVHQDQRINLASGLGVDFDAVLDCAMHPHPQQRYMTPLALIEDLQRAATRRPVSVRSSSVSYRWWCFLRRNGWRLAGGVTVGVLAAGIGATTWQQHAQARQSQEQTAAVTRFLGGLFNPSGGVSPSGIEANTPAKDVLRIAVQRMRKELPDSPEAQRAILVPAVDWFDALGLQDEAHAASRDLLKLAEAQEGQESSAYADALTRQAKLLIRVSKEAVALPLAEQAVALCERLCEKPSLASALSARALARQALEPWPYVRADEDHQRAIALLRPTGASEALAARIQDLARLWSNTNREQQALDLLTEARAIMTRVHGAQSWPTATILREMAGLERVLMRPDQARAHFDEAVAIMERGFGADAPPTQSLRLMRAELLLPSDDHAALREDLAATARRYVRAGEPRRSRFDWALELRLAADVRHGYLAQASAQCDRMDRAALLKGNSALLIADHCARQAIATRSRVGASRWLTALATVIWRDYNDAPMVMKRLRQREGEWAQANGNQATATARFLEVLSMTEQIDLRERALAWRGLAQIAPDKVDTSALSADVAFVERASAKGLLAEHRAQLYEAQAWLAAHQRDWAVAIARLERALADRARHGGTQSAWHADGVRWRAAWAAGRPASAFSNGDTHPLDTEWLKQLDTALAASPSNGN